MNKTQILKESCKEKIVYVIVAISESSCAPVEFYPKILQILSDFSDIMLDELSNELLIPRGIQHVIGFVPGSTLPNLPHCRMNPTTHDELR